MSSPKTSDVSSRLRTRSCATGSRRNQASWPSTNIWSSRATPRRRRNWRSRWTCPHGHPGTAQSVLTWTTFRLTVQAGANNAACRCALQLLGPSSHGCSSSRSPRTIRRTRTCPCSWTTSGRIVPIDRSSSPRTAHSY